MPETCKSVTITVTTEATAVKSQYLNKKHLLIEALRSNQGKIYIALAYDLFTGRKETDYEAIKPSELRFYGAPETRHIAYIWYYAETSGDGFKYTASEGSLEHPIYPQDYRLLKFVREKITVTLVNNTTKTEIRTVPAGKRWLIVGGWLHNGDDVARGCYVQAKDAASVGIGYFRKDSSMPAGDKNRFPNFSDNDQYSFDHTCYPVSLNAGELVVFGWAAGGVSAGGIAVNFFEYYEVDLS